MGSGIRPIANRKLLQELKMKIRRATLLLSLIASAFISAGAMAQQTQPA